jgi:hypothetical protein
MQPTTLISIREFCVHHHVETTFVETLADNGLIQTTIIEQITYVEPTQLTQLEKFVRLHRDLHIHTDDLDIVSDLLDRMESLQCQLQMMQNRLRFYER